MAEPARYRLSLTHPVQLELALLNRRATLFGLAARLARALRHIQEQLIATPTEWGEPSHTLRGMRITLYSGFHDRLLVSCGVHEFQPLVVIRRIEAQLGHPLYRDTDSDT